MFSRGIDKYPDNFNAKMVSKYGLDLCRGLKAFAESDFSESYRLLRSVRFDWLQNMAGSRAQVDILNQVLIQSAIKSGNRNAAKNLLKERMTSCAFVSDEDLLNERLQAKIKAMM